MQLKHKNKNKTKLKYKNTIKQNIELLYFKHHTLISSFFSR